MPNKETNWLSFEEQSQVGKTKVFHVFNKGNRSFLGAVQWHGAFRQYSYYSNGNIVYDVNCLKDITSFIQNLMLERKIEKQNSNQN